MGKTSVHLLGSEIWVIRRYHHGIFFSISCVAIAVENLTRRRRRKIATRRLISRIILESVVNASSRRRRGLVDWLRSLSFIKKIKYSISLMKTSVLPV